MGQVFKGRLNSQVVGESSQIGPLAGFKYLIAANGAADEASHGKAAQNRFALSHSLSFIAP